MDKKNKMPQETTNETGKIYDLEDFIKDSEQLMKEIDKTILDKYGKQRLEEIHKCSEW